MHLAWCKSSEVGYWKQGLSCKRGDSLDVLLTVTCKITFVMVIICVNNLIVSLSSGSCVVCILMNFMRNEMVMFVKFGPFGATSSLRRKYQLNCVKWSKYVITCSLAKLISEIVWKNHELTCHFQCNL